MQTNKELCELMQYVLEHVNDKIEREAIIAFINARLDTRLK